MLTLRIRGLQVRVNAQGAGGPGQFPQLFVNPSQLQQIAGWYCFSAYRPSSCCSRSRNELNSRGLVICVSL